VGVEHDGRPEPERQFILSYLSGHLPQAFIVGGPPGVGKATLAWRLARYLLANPDPAAAMGEARADLFVAPDHPVSRQIAALTHPDLVLLRREWNEKDKRFFTEIRVEDVRRATHMFQQAAGRGGYRICILDCAEDLNPSSANALLKLVEEPPPRSLFLIVAHRPGKMLATLRSRCQKILLKPLAAAAIGQFVAALGPPWSAADEAKLESARDPHAKALTDCGVVGPPRGGIGLTMGPLTQPTSATYGSRMPLTGGYLSEADIERVRQWIAAGANP
jgi:DNA polymerase-3 subunit delta'